MSMSKVLSDQQALDSAKFVVENKLAYGELAKWIIAAQGRIVASRRMDRLRLDEETILALLAFVASNHANRDHPVTADAIRAVLDAQREIFGG